MASFEDVMMARLAKCHVEACREVLAGMKTGRSLGDAIADTIESLPASKSRELRRWLNDWEAWEEWRKYAANGWSIKKKGGNIFLYAPSTHPTAGPERAAVAAGAGVQSVKYVGDSNGHGRYNGPSQYSYDAVLITQYVVGTPRWEGSR